MEIKRIKEKSIHDAMQKVRDELGPDAVILSTEKYSHGVEILAANDFDVAELEQQHLQQNQSTKSMRTRKPAPVKNTMTDNTMGEICTILQKNLSDHMEGINQTFLQYQLHASEQNKKAHNEINKKIETLYQSFHDGHQDQQRASSKNFTALQNQVTQLRDNFSDYITGMLPDELNSITQIQEELGGLKDVLGCQTKLLDWENWSKNNPIGISLISKLINAGFGVGLSKKVMAKVSKVTNREEAWKKVVSMLGRGIKTPVVDVQQQGGVVMALGRTGVGKTTTLAKIATNYVIKHGSNDVVFINLDDQRVGSFDQLDTYGKILNVPVYRFNGKENIRSILKVMRNKSLVLIDTAGLIEPGENIEKFVNGLTRNNIKLHKLLLMSANTQLHSLKEIIASFKKCSPNGCVITKTDESSQLGNVLTVAIEDRLPIYFETFGQQVPEDISVIKPPLLIKRAIESHTDATNATADDGLLLGGINTNGNTK